MIGSAKVCATRSYLRAAMPDRVPIISTCVPPLCVLSRPCIPSLAYVLPVQANECFLELRWHCVARGTQASAALPEFEAGGMGSKPAGGGVSATVNAADGALGKRPDCFVGWRHGAILCSAGRCGDLAASRTPDVMLACPKS